MKKVPNFASEAEERRFWESADSTEYVNWKKAQRVVFPNLKPSLRTISVRLPESMIEELKLLANKRDVPYQSLLKIFLGERIEQELRSVHSKRAKRLKTFNNAIAMLSDIYFDQLRKIVFLPEGGVAFPEPP